jgi:hypothetical protein
MRDFIDTLQNRILINKKGSTTASTGKANWSSQRARTSRMLSLLTGPPLCIFMEGLAIFRP